MAANYTAPQMDYAARFPRPKARYLVHAAGRIYLHAWTDDYVFACALRGSSSTRLLIVETATWRVML